MQIDDLQAMADLQAMIDAAETQQESALAFGHPDHSACRSCGLHFSCGDKEPFAEPEFGGSNNPDDPMVVVVVSGYHPDVTSLDHPGGHLLRIVLDGMENVRWCLTGTLRCPPPRGKMTIKGTNTKDNSKHQICTMAFLPPIQIAYDAAVVVLLGQEALEVGLGRHAPKSLLAATKRVFSPIEGAAMVVVGRSPWAHRPDEGESIQDDYVELFTRAEKIAHGDTGKTEFPYVETSEVKTALEICKALPQNFTFDPEYSAHENDPLRRSYWFKHSELLCWSIEWRDAGGVSNTATFLPPAAKHPAVWEAAFRGRIPCAHFAKNDFQAPFALAGIDVFPWIKRQETGEIEHRDPGAEIHLCNQSRAGLGILSLAMKAFGAPNWKQQKDDLINEANKLLDKQWRDYNAWKNRKGPAWAEVRAWYKTELKRKTCTEKLVNPQSKPATVSAARKWLKSNPSRPCPPLPAEPVKPEKPPGTCGYDSVIPYLYHYCAEDSYFTTKVLQEVVPQEIKTLGGCGPLVKRLLARITELTCQVERIGLPVDMDRAEVAVEMFREAVVALKRNMLSSDHRVVLALSEQAGFHEAILKGVPADEAAIRYTNPASNLFRLSLAKHLGVNIAEHRAKFRTKSGAPSFGKLALKVLSGSGPWEEATSEQQVWRVFAKLKGYNDIISKFKMFRHTVDGFIRTDYRVIKVDRADHGGGGKEAGTETGRLSAGFLQGLKKDPAFRCIFKAPPGWIFVEVDYSTLEPRILAFIADIEDWQVWFRRKLDLYCGMANKMYDLGVDLDGVDAEVAKALKGCIDDDERQVMKRCFLAQMYMQGAASLAEAAGISLERAQEFTEYFHKAFPQLKKLQDKLWEAMVSGQPVTTPFGRQAYADLPHKNDANFDEKMASLHRHFWNFPVQGTGSDICLWLGWVFMRKLQIAGRWGGPQQNNPNSWGAVGNLVHDAMWSLVRVEHFREYVLLKAETMEDRSLLPFHLPVAIDVEIKAGTEMSNLKSVDRWDPQIPKEK